MVEAAERAIQYCDGMHYDAFLRDHKTQDAVTRNIEILGEAVKNIGTDFRSAHGNIPWKNITGMRDKLIHDYFGANFDVIWNVVNDELPNLLAKLKELIPEPE
ncbi:hypothetical protein PDESU_03850 [Pontiella desulfatans]|uniref:DUF86 domain-containing protein n=2 Tax=Pontiella desulfatans TaxID=2750659 RepID=A0A6C2U5C4_PONDE|nr:hypothetical protein PDESU_03850 [Pontiella desulfatans]